MSYRNRTGGCAIDLAGSEHGFVAVRSDFGNGDLCFKVHGIV
jgi:hypothetical protein